MERRDMNTSRSSDSPSVTLSGERPPLRNSIRQHRRLMDERGSPDTVADLERRLSRSPTRFGHPRSPAGSPPRSPPRSPRESGPEITVHREMTLQISPSTTPPTPPGQTHVQVPIHQVQPQVKIQSPAVKVQSGNPMIFRRGVNASTESGQSITFYPYYLRTIDGIFKIIEIIISIIICATVDASQCAAYAVCGQPSSYVWRSIMAGQGFVLFVAIMFIFGNIALIIFHVLKRPIPIPKLAERMLTVELLYLIAAVALFVIAACVESWYASGTELNITPNQNYLLLANQIVPNPFRPQWIAAAVFTWINAMVYAGNLVHLRMVRRDQE